MKTAFVFPGQGAQFVGMGKDLFEASDLAKEVYQLADELASQEHKISELSFNGPEEELKRTLYTQPAILTMSLALAKLAKDAIGAGKITAPAFVAGHSLGEFAALYMADVIDLETTIKLVAKRAALMEQAPAGAMTAIVGMDEAKLNGMVDATEGVSVANYNSPDQIVITGTAEAVKTIEDQVNAFATENELKIRVISLAVGGAFHSPLMQAASDDFAKEIDAANFADAKIPVVQNFSANAVTASAEIKENLKKQMTGSVRWTETVKLLFAESIESALELGPGKVLAGLFKKQDRRFPVKSIATMEDFSALTLVHQ